MERFNKGGMQVILASYLFFMVSTAVQAAPVSTVFTAKIASGGSCDVSLPDSLSFNNGEAIAPSDIENQSATTKQSFNLTLVNCQGIGLAPKISVSGNTTTDYGEAMFVDSVSDVKGYGFFLLTTGNDNFKANTNLARNKEIAVTDSWVSGSSLSELNGVLPINAELTCGNCYLEGRIGGDLSATVTFEFEYD